MTNIEKDFDKLWDEQFVTGGDPRFKYQKEKILNFIRAVVKEEKKKWLKEVEDQDIEVTLETEQCLSIALEVYTEWERRMQPPLFAFTPFKMWVESTLADLERTVYNIRYDWKSEYPYQCMSCGNVYSTERGAKKHKCKGETNGSNL